MDSRNRVYYLDYLRIAATFAVIVLHVAAQNWSTADVHSLAWNTFNIYDSAVRWAVPIFVMISGSLFLNPEKVVTIQDIYSKYILRIITAFLAWSIFYAVVHNYSDFSIKSFLASIIVGSYHMWFLYMIVGLYIITPILRKITASMNMTKYFVAVSVVFTFIIPFLLKLPILNKAQSIYDNVYFHFTLGFSSYFVAGYYLSKIQIDRKIRVIIYISGMLGFLMTVGITAYLSIKSGEPVSDYYNNFSIGVMLESVAVFTYGKYRKCKDMTAKRCKLLTVLSKCSFGAYLVHIFIISVLSKICGINTLSFNPIIAVPVISIITALLSFAISYVANKIPIINKYVV